MFLPTNQVSSPTRRKAPSRLSLGALSLGFALLAAACGNNAYCDGPDCNCNGDRECIVSCGDDCDAACSHTQDTCGAICGDACSFDCSNTSDCSSLSGDGSYVSCHNLQSCAAECGANCTYDAHDVTDVRITVGPNSTVRCSSLSDCLVTCEGDCDVSCASVSTCSVKCADGNVQNAGSGSHEVSCR